MSFLFIDKITSLEPAKKAIGIKTITNSDNLYFDTSSHKDDILLPCLLAECVGQLCGWLVMQHNDFSLRPVAILYDEIYFYGHAKLGDTLLIETELKSLDEKTSLFDGYVKVGDKILLSVHHAAGAFLSMQDFIDPQEVKHQFNSIYRSEENETSSLSIGMQKKRFVSHPMKQTSFSQRRESSIPHSQKNCINDKRKSLKPINLNFDAIVSANENHIIVEKTIDPAEPFFADHFPNKPVMPISLLLQSYVNLTLNFLNKHFINDHTGKTQNFQLNKINNVKIKEFIQPGKPIITTLKLKNHEDNLYRFSCISEVDGKRVCLATFEFVSL